MTVLTKTNGVYTIKPGDTLSAVAASQGRSLADLLATNPQFKSNPNLIQPGQTVNYSNLAGTPPASNGSVGNVTPPALNGSTTSFTTALIQMLKDAQQRDTTGQASLMKQSQGITGLGLNDARMNFRNKLLAPNAGTSLGLSAQNEFDPLQLSISNQQKLASNNLSNITDLVKQASSDYQDEQDRLEKAKENAVTQAHKAATTSSSGITYTPTQIQSLKQGFVDKNDDAAASYFLNTPPEFQNFLQRENAGSPSTQKYSVEDLHQFYTAWYNNIKDDAGA